MIRTECFQAILFDMDGTLVDNMSFHTRALLEIAEQRFGVRLDPDQVGRDFSGVKNAEIFRILAQRDVTPEEAKAWEAEKEERYRELYGPHRVPLRGVRELLARLREHGLRTAVASAARPTIATNATVTKKCRCMSVMPPDRCTSTTLDSTSPALTSFGAVNQGTVGLTGSGGGGASGLSRSSSNVSTR